MGRVLVFSLPSCAACRAAKALLTSHGVVYEDVSLEAQPARRGEVAAAAGRSSVPQVPCRGRARAPAAALGVHS